jgi:fructose 1,6-bisphosphate aldolase/phosphatase
MNITLSVIARGAGQDLLKDAFSGDARRMGPTMAEIEFGERPNDRANLGSAPR